VDVFVVVAVVAGKPRKPTRPPRLQEARRPTNIDLQGSDSKPSVFLWGLATGYRLDVTLRVGADMTVREEIKIPDSVFFRARHHQSAPLMASLSKPSDESISEIDATSAKSKVPIWLPIAAVSG